MKNITLFLLFISCSSLFCVNANETDSLRTLADRLPQNDTYANEAVRPTEKEELWRTYFETAKQNINTLIMNEEFEYAIDEAIKMRDKATELNNHDGKLMASISLATAYISSDRINESIQVLKTAYKDAPQTNHSLALMELQSLLASTARCVNDYDNMHIYLNDLSNTIQEYLKDKPLDESDNNIFMFIDVHHIYYYVAKGRPQEALKYIKKVEALKGHRGFIAHRDIFYDACAEYYSHTKDYNRAIAAADSSIVGLKTFMPKDYYRRLIKKATILSEAGKYTEALALYQECLQGKDSVDHVLSRKQMEQIQHIYKVNKLLLENEQIRSNRSIIILVIILLFTTLVALFIIHALFVRRKLKESENEMRKATQMAEEGNEIKNLFLSNMSYNIRTPLNNVVGFSQLMAVDPDMDEAQRKEYSSIIKQNSEVLLNLVNDMLDISRLEAGMMKFNLQDYEVITLCREAIYTAQEKSQSIDIDFQPGFEEQQIKVDIFRFRQLLVSLLTHPTSATKNTTIKLIVTLNKADRCVCFKTIGSPIAHSEFVTHKFTIRNDINNLFLNHFGGTYNVYAENPEGPTITFTYPLSVSE